MLRIVELVIVAVMAGWIACALPVDEKTGCMTARDCVEDRVCVEGQCTTGACGLVCLEACERVADCGAAVPDCEAECLDDDGLLPGFDADACKRQWDVLLADDDCDAPTCLTICRDLCERAAECRLVIDAAACTIGCQEAEAGCPTVVPSGCADVPPEVLCYESGRC